MMKIQHPLPAPTPAEIELAKTDADARKRVRKQMLRVKRREEEIGAAACPAPAAAVTQTTLPQTPHTAAAEAAAVEANPTCGQDALKVVMALVKQSEAGSKRGRGATIPKLEAATYAVSICDWGRVGLAEHVTVMRKFLGTGVKRRWRHHCVHRRRRRRGRKRNLNPILPDWEDWEGLGVRTGAVAQYQEISSLSLYRP
jgi:hypothetical protein